MALVKIKPKRPNLTYYQKDFLYNPERFTVTEAGTKTGKTFAHIWWLFELAHGFEDGKKVLDIKEGMNFWWVAPVYGQAKIAYRRMWMKLRNSGAYTTNRGDLTITTPEGAVIWFRSAQNPDLLYGEDVYGVVFDEFTRAKIEAWYALRSTLTATKGKCKFIGNYKGNSNWGHQLGLKALEDKNYAYFKVTAWQAVEAGILDQEEIQQAKKDLPPFMFRALYEAEGDIDDSRLISDDAIEDIKTNNHVQSDVEAGTKYISADLAFMGSDRFVIMVWSGLRIIHLEVIDKSSGKDIELKIKSLAEKFAVRRSNIVYDADGVGTYLQGYLKGAKAFKARDKPIKEKGRVMEYANLKSQMGFKLAENIEGGEMFFDCKNLEDYWHLISEELEMLRNRSHGTDNKLEIMRKDDMRKIIARSPDFLDTLIMRMVFEYKRGLNYV